MVLDRSIKKKILIAQKNEITEHFIYARLSNAIKDEKNKKVLEQISKDELGHYGIFRGYTKEDVGPSKFRIWKYFWISKIFGLTFGVKLMEKGEENAQISYDEIGRKFPPAKKIQKDENEHEQKLLSMIDEEKLKYAGSVVLGLNDALVELTGSLAGFTLALQKTRLVAVTGLIAGIAASLSMAASEYLSTKSEGGSKSPLKASVYTGIAYVLTVLFLIFPYLVMKNAFFALGWTILNVIIVILIFTYYISVAKGLSFKRRFWEMALISLTVAALSFGIGYLVRIFLGAGV